MQPSKGSSLQQMRGPSPFKHLSWYKLTRRGQDSAVWCCAPSPQGKSCVPCLGDQMTSSRSGSNGIGEGAVWEDGKTHWVPGLVDALASLCPEWVPHRVIDMESTCQVQWKTVCSSLEELFGVYRKSLPWLWFLVDQKLPKLWLEFPVIILIPLSPVLSREMMNAG